MTMMRTMTVAAMLLTATPGMAQTTPTPAPTPTSAPAAPPPVFTVQPIPPTDPARLAAARPVIDRIWPMGTYARMMRTIMGPYMQGSIAQVMAMKPGDLIPGMGAKDGKDTKPEDNETLAQMAAKQDPYYQQRIALSMNAVGDAMAELMTKVEPGVRDAMAHAYARRFTVAQLGELDRFFATPTGQAYATDQMQLMMSPDMAQAMQTFLPEMVKAAPDLVARVTAATKDLPPPGTTAKKTP